MDFIVDKTLLDRPAQVAVPAPDKPLEVWLIRQQLQAATLNAHEDAGLFGVVYLLGQYRSVGWFDLSVRIWWTGPPGRSRGRRRLCCVRLSARCGLVCTERWAGERFRPLWRIARWPAGILGPGSTKASLAPQTSAPAGFLDDPADTPHRHILGYWFGRAVSLGLGGHRRRSR